MVDAEDGLDHETGPQPQEGSRREITQPCAASCLEHAPSETDAPCETEE
jgi:hypothetical protein